MSDKESSVRKDLVDFFSVLLPALPAATTEAFSGPIAAHLCCALAHIDDHVQRDALNFLDVLVERAPAVIAGCYAQVSQGRDASCQNRNQLVFSFLNDFAFNFITVFSLHEL